MTFGEFEKLVSGLYVLFVEYVDPEISEESIGIFVSCVGTPVVLKYMDDLHIGAGEKTVVVEYPENDEEYLKEKVNLLYKTLVRLNSGLNKSSNI